MASFETARADPLVALTAAMPDRQS